MLVYCRIVSSWKVVVSSIRRIYNLYSHTGVRNPFTKVRFPIPSMYMYCIFTYMKGWFLMVNIWFSCRCTYASSHGNRHGIITQDQDLNHRGTTGALGQARPNKRSPGRPWDWFGGKTTRRCSRIDVDVLFRWSNEDEGNTCMFLRSQGHYIWIYTVIIQFFSFIVWRVWIYIYIYV